MVSKIIIIFFFSLFQCDALVKLNYDVLVDLLIKELDPTVICKVVQTPLPKAVNLLDALNELYYATLLTSNFASIILYLF